MGKNQIISVIFKQLEIGKVGYDEHQKKSFFQYNSDFLASGKYTNLFPYIIRRAENVQVFSEYEGETFKGLPPVIADSLPDFFGNIVFKEWLEASNKKAISPLEQLAYVANRGMGALEYSPAKKIPSTATINIEEITEVVKKVMDLKTSVAEKELTNLTLLNIFKIGTSAGGARPKILVSEHKKTGMLIPGDIETSEAYNHYLVKLNIDEDSLYNRELIEYIYYEIATRIGIEMMPSKLIDNKHFATLRFDRINGEKRHILTVSGITGWDYVKSEQSNYENLFKLAVSLKLPHSEMQQLYKRMIFNVVFANTDDHLKNFSFIYDDQQNRWNLSPAYDLTYPFNPLLSLLRVSRALSINGKRHNITREDVLSIAKNFSIKDAGKIIKQVNEAIPLFHELALKYDVPEIITHKISQQFQILA